MGVLTGVWGCFVQGACLGYFDGSQGGFRAGVFFFSPRSEECARKRTMLECGLDGVYFSFVGFLEGPGRGRLCSPFNDTHLFLRKMLYWVIYDSDEMVTRRNSMSVLMEHSLGNNRWGLRMLSWTWFARFIKKKTKQKTEDPSRHPKKKATTTPSIHLNIPSFHYFPHPLQSVSQII